MKQLKLILAGVFLAFLSLDSSMAQQAVLSSGLSSGDVSYSVGQLVYESYQGTSGSISGGVQQAYTVEVLSGVEEKTIELQLTAYPNPTQDYLNLKVDSDHRTLDYRLSDITGQSIASGTLESQIARIETEGLASSTYYLTVFEKGSLIKTFKIIKN